MMKDSMIQVICGPGKGKTASALGRGVSALIRGKNVIMVQFLKGSMDSDNMEVLKRLEPEFKLFRFEKSPMVFDRLSDEEKEEARINIRNGLNFSKKVLVTGECDILILDEILASCNYGMVQEQSVVEFLKNRPSGLEVVLTGREPSENLVELANYVSEIRMRKHPYQKGIPARKGIEF